MANKEQKRSNREAKKPKQKKKGADKRAAAEFSFFLAMPTMAGAFTYDLFKNYGQLDSAALQSIAIGFVVAFIAGVVVVRYLLEFVSRYGFAPFAWWRIVVGNRTGSGGQDRKSRRCFLRHRQDHRSHHHVRRLH